MASPTLTKGHTFSTREQVTSTKLHNLVDLADWLITDQAAGDMVYFDGTNWLRIAKGTNGQVMTMGASAPAWAAGGINGVVDDQALTLTLQEPSVSIDGEYDTTVYVSALHLGV